MTFNNIFLPLVLLIAAITFVRSRGYRGWQVAAVVVIAIALIAEWFAEGLGAVAGAAAFVLFIFLPGRLFNWMSASQTAAEYKRAVQWSYVAQALHPVYDWKTCRDAYRVRYLETSGNTDQAIAIAQRYLENDSALGWSIASDYFHMRKDWAGASAYLTRHTQHVLNDTNLLWLEIRARATNEPVENLLKRYAELRPHLLSRRSDWCYVLCMVLAYAGRVGALTSLLDAVRPWQHENRMNWQAVALQVAGQTDAANTILTRIANGHDPIAAKRAATLIEKPTTPLPLPLAEPLQQQIRSIEQDVDSLIALYPSSKTSWVDVPITSTLIGINVFIHLLSWLPWVLALVVPSLAGAIYSEDIAQNFWQTIAQSLMNLDRLGMLVPQLVLREGEWWRMVSMMFLHANVFHLGFNLFALRMFGRTVETHLGGWRYLITYLGAGLLANVGLIVLALISPERMNDAYVGASGCIMGLVGAMLGWHFIHWRRHSKPADIDELKSLLWVMGGQFVLDWVVPGISFAAHAMGAAVGFLIGLFFAVRLLLRKT
jgi:rhomboid protease GluP